MIDREKILVENELYKILEYAKDGNEEKIIIEEYCKNNNISIKLAKEVIEKMRMKKRDLKRQQDIER